MGKKKITIFESNGLALRKFLNSIKWFLIIKYKCFNFEGK